MTTGDQYELLDEYDKTGNGYDYTNDVPTSKRYPVATGELGRLLGRLTSEQRKRYPVATGFLDYFPDAVALVAHLSWAAGAKHHPGEPTHWERSKSTDQPDCLARHLIERDGSDYITLESGEVVEIPHRVALAWRAMAELQIWAEKTYNLSLPPGARP